MRKASLFHKIILAAVTAVFIALCLFMGLTAAQNYMRLKLQMKVSPNVLCEIAIKGTNEQETAYDVIFNNQTSFIKEGVSLSANVLTLSTAITSAYASPFGTSFDLKITNLLSETCVVYVSGENASADVPYVVMDAKDTANNTAEMSIFGKTETSQFTLEFAVPTSLHNVTINGGENEFVLAGSSKLSPGVDYEAMLVCQNKAYIIESIAITANGNAVDSQNYTWENHKLTIKSSVLNGDVVITPTTKAKTFTIEYDLNGGENHEDNPTTYTIETETFSLQTPTRYGCEFAGWSGTGVDGTSMQVTIDQGSIGARKFTAQWTTTNPSITFDANGGHTTTTSKVVIENQPYGALPEATMSNGFVFQGWFTEATGGTQITAETIYTTETAQTLYAHYEEKFYTLYEGPTINQYFTGSTKIIFGYWHDYKHLFNCDFGEIGALVGDEIISINSRAISYILSQGHILAHSDSSYLFNGCEATTNITFDNFTAHSLTNTSYMFYDCYRLTSLDLSNFNTSQVTDMRDMFYNCNNLTTLDLSNFDTSNVTNMSSMFSNCSGLTSLDVSNFDTSNVTDMGYMFRICSSLSSLDLSIFNTSQVTNMSFMFAWCRHLTSLDLSNFNTSQVTDMRDMFYNCNNLTSLDLSNFDTSNVTNMSSMFSNCSGLTRLDLSNFNTSQVTSMKFMFSGCESLNSLGLSNFNTSQVTNMGYMFSSCSGLTSLDVSNFNTSQVTDMGAMFAGCNQLTSLDVSKFNTSQVTDMSSMFSNCSGLTSLDVTKFDTSQVTDMAYMFRSCGSLSSLDLSSFNTDKVTTMRVMFQSCGNLVTIYTKYATKEDFASGDTGGWLDNCPAVFVQKVN